jgi:hypothetical protein
MSYLRQKFRQPFSTIQLRNTTRYEYEKIIHSLKCKNSYGYDEIPSRILKISTPYVLSPLTYVFNKSLSTDIFPDRLKFSEVKPLFNKGDETEVSNYSHHFILHFLKLLKKLFIKDCTATQITIIYWSMNNLVLGKNFLLKWHLSHFSIKYCYYRITL